MVSASTIDRFPVLQSSGPTWRTPTQGTEYELLTDFVNDQLPPARHDQLRTVFVEPRIEGGFPDAVVIYWDANIAQHWPTCRGELCKHDIRVLHYLACNGPIDEADLELRFSKGLQRTLEGLDKSGLAAKRSGRWRLKPMNQIFAVQRLIAIEAKMSE